jgi:hypothetical protein
MPMPPMHQPTPTSTRERPHAVRQGGGPVKGPERAPAPTWGTARAQHAPTKPRAAHLFLARGLKALG